jgi:hypothetical protein
MTIKLAYSALETTRLKADNDCEPLAREGPPRGSMRKKLSSNNSVALPRRKLAATATVI